MPLFPLPEHKIGFFVRFCPPEPPFSGLSSTKSGFLCVFTLRNPHFRPFRAQNRGFCALLPAETPIFGHSEHKIEVFVRFCQQVFPDYGFYGLPASSIFPMAIRHSAASHKELRHSAPASNKPHPAEKSTLVWLAIWHIWAGFANSQLQCATFHSNYSYKCTSSLLPAYNRCSDIANLSAHLHRLPTPPTYLRRMRLLHGLGASIRWMMRLSPCRGRRCWMSGEVAAWPGCRYPMDDEAAAWLYARVLGAG